MKVYFDSGAKSSGGREDAESSGPQRRNSSEANSGDFLDLKVSATMQGERRALRFMPFRNEILTSPPRPSSTVLRLAIGVLGFVFWFCLNH